MKTKMNSYTGLRLLIISLFGMLVFLINLSCSDQESDQQVFEAYNLRISGHADSARLLLDKIVEDNPEMALAWYELARTTLHMEMNNPQEIDQTLEKANTYMGKAISCEPKNALYYSYKGGLETLQFYMALQMGKEDAGSYLVQLEETYNTVFQLDPSYYENKITLVEFFGGLPEDMGGDKVKAEKYTKELEEADLVSGAKAREILMPEDADYEAFWKAIIIKAPESADALQALGRVYLFMGNFENASQYYQQAIELDQSKNVLYLDLGRYQLMKAMQNPAVLDSIAPLVKVQFDKFLGSEPEPLNPMKAWTYSKLAMISSRTGNETGAETLMKKATDLDPYHSAAFGRPGNKAYCSPDKVIHEQSYFLSPF